MWKWIFLYNINLTVHRNCNHTILHNKKYLSTLGIGLFLITGLSGYQANFIQLDQLLDVPSEYLGLFVHWLEVFTEVGFFFILRPIFVMFDYPECNQRNPVYYAVLALLFLFLSLVLLLLLLGCWKHHWFYTEPGQALTLIKWYLRYLILSGGTSTHSGTVPSHIVVLKILPDLTLPRRGMEDISP